jgi:hypothetical protein
VQYAAKERTQMHITLAKIFLLCALLVFFLLGTGRSLNTLSYAETIEIVLTDPKKFQIDVVILSPTLQSDDQVTDYTMQSVVRFMPWIRRIHISRPAKTDFDFEDFANSEKRVVEFSHKLQKYSLTAPFLSEHFIIVHPFCLFTNHVFPWQFFIHGSPVVRTNGKTCTAITRTILNDLCFLPPPGESGESDLSLIAAAVKEGIRNSTIVHHNNQDRFTETNHPTETSSIKKISVFREDIVAKYIATHPHRQPSVHPTLENIRIIVCENYSDNNVCLPEEFEISHQVWVALNNQQNNRERLGFVHRSIVAGDTLFEVNPEVFKNNCEKIAVNILQKIKQLTANNARSASKVIAVHWVPTTRRFFSTQKMLLQTAGKVSAHYACAISQLPVHNNPDAFHLKEMERRRFV